MDDEEKAWMEGVKKEYDWYFRRNFIQKTIDFFRGRKPPQLTEMFYVDSSDELMMQTANKLRGGE